MRSLLQDLRYAARTLSKSPGFTAVAVATLALGIGANTLVFSLFESLLLRPFPFPNLDRLVTVWEEPPAHGGGPQVHRRPLSPGDFLDLRREATSFEKTAAFRYRDFRLTAVAEAADVRGVSVDQGFFETLGARPTTGVAFGPTDFEPGRDRVAIVSEAFWRRELGTDPGVLSRELLLDGERYAIRGVMPADFHYPLGSVEIWTPLAFRNAEESERSVSDLVVVARLKKSLGLVAARAEVGAIARRLERRYPRSNTGRRLTLLPLREEQAGVIAPLLSVFGAAAVFVLLAACANVANLQLARSVARRGEIAVRMALGAGRWRIGRQLAVESLLLSAGGLGLSVWLVDIGLEGIRRSLPQGIAVWFAGWRNIGLHGPAFAFGASVALATTVLFGLLPLARLRRAGPGALDLRGRASSAFGRKGGLSGSLVVVQVSLALVLLAGAAATVRGFLRLVSLYEDLDPDHVVTMHLGLSDASRGPAFFGRLVSSVGALPGVRSVAAVSQLPGDLGPIPTRRLRIEGRPVPQSNEEPTVDLQTITPDYFRALRVRFVRGRMFDGGDGTENTRVAILSESAARRYFPRADPIGARVAFASAESETSWRTIVGVVSDVRQYWFDRQARPTLYVPLTQSPRTDMFLLIRSEGDPAQIVPAVRREVREIDPGQPVEEVRSLRGVVDESAALVRIGASTLSVTGLLALLLSAVGIFGVVSYTSARSTRDIGIRMALGARPSDVLRSVMAGAARLSLLGTGIGLAGAVVLTRLLSTALFGIAPGDPYIFGAVVVLLLATAAAACYFPARRATKVDPAEALRAE